MSALSKASSDEQDQGIDAELYRKVAGFHRGDVVNYFPRREDFVSPTFLEDYVLKGWLPAQPFVTRETKITAFGSCFAANITRHLSGMGYDLSSERDPGIYVSRLSDGMVNTAAILGQFEWALENKTQPTDLWHGFKAEGYGYDEDIRLRTRAIFLDTEFFVITLGLSEIWYDELSGGTFWRAVPESAFDPRRHKFRVMSVAETKADIAKMHALIREHVPGAKILITVSPIPLAATFRPASCMTANAVSKAVIRAALDEFLREHGDELNETLFYFPSMEIVQFGFADSFGSDGRHPVSYVLDTVMKTFEATYCKGEATLKQANEMLQMFRAENLRDINSRTGNEGEKVKLLKAAKLAKRAGLVARAQAKARDVNLDRMDDEPSEGREPKARRVTQSRQEPKAQEPRDRHGDNPKRAQKRAERQARRRERKRAKENRSESMDTA